jgi:DNA modification methylase
LFHKLNPKITKTLIDEQPDVAFELMHKELDKVYDQCLQVIKNDAIICINIGDATRTINGLFRLFTNGARTVQYFLNKGFTQLPSIIWHKPTNSPNKFMGSGMLPVGAYTTLEHEHILVFRKNKRIFQSDEDIKNRRSSAFFQYERNL